MKCSKCSQEAAEGRRYCAKHAALNAERVQRWRVARREYHNAYMREWRAAKKRERQREEGTD